MGLSICCSLYGINIGEPTKLLANSNGGERMNLDLTRYGLMEPT